MAQVFVFSAQWCGACPAVKRALQRHGIRYRVVDVDSPTGARRADALHVRSIPAVFVRDDNDRWHRVAEPTPARVRAALERHGS